MRTYRLRVRRDLDVSSKGQLSRRPGSMTPSPSRNSPWGLRVPHRAVWYRPGGSHCFRLRGLGDVNARRFSDLGVVFYPIQAPLAPRDTVYPRPAAEDVVSKPCRTVSVLGKLFSSPGYRSCRDLQGFLNWGWHPIFPSSGEPSTALYGWNVLVQPQPYLERCQCRLAGV